jgi:myosin heavy subunit
MSLASAPLNTIVPHATAFATAMTNYNIWGQTALMIQRLEDKREHFEGLCAAAQRAVCKIDQSIDTLKQEKEGLKEAEGYLKEVKQKISERTRKREALQEQVEELRKTKGVVLASQSYSTTRGTKLQRSSAPPAPITSSVVEITEPRKRTRLTESPNSSRASSVDPEHKPLNGNPELVPEKTGGTSNRDLSDYAGQLPGSDSKKKADVLDRLTRPQA